MNSEASRFIIIGLVSNLINYVIYWGAANAGSSLILASLIGYAAGLYNSFYFGRRWVFKVRKRTPGPMALRFVAIYFVGGFGMAGVIKVVEYWLGWDYRLAWFTGAGFAMVNNFLGSKWLVFKKDLE